eukprot:COSAG04_NODE_517_length_13186_cov_7.434248_7_plen_174_part_00
MVLVERRDRAAVHDVDVGIHRHLVVALVRLCYAPLVSERLGGGLRARGDGHDRGAGHVGERADPVGADVGGAEDSPAQLVVDVVRLRQAEPDVERRAAGQRALQAASGEASGRERDRRVWRAASAAPRRSEPEQREQPQQRQKTHCSDHRAVAVVGHRGGADVGVDVFEPRGC